jgi:beta-carotene 3-hydroxylase
MGMAIWLGVLLSLGTLIDMGAVAYAVHRWVMHGFGWLLHESHHRARTVIGR